MTLVQCLLSADSTLLQKSATGLVRQLGLHEIHFATLIDSDTTGREQGVCLRTILRYQRKEKMFLSAFMDVITVFFFLGGIF